MNAQYVRKARIILLSPSLWRKRLVFWLGAISVGFIASGFALAADWAQKTFDAIVGTYHWAPLVVSPLLFGIIAWLTQKFFPSVPGSGIPQAIAARILRDRASREYLLGAQVIIGKIFLTILGILAGASIGREGPTVQVGAAIMMLCARFGGLSAERGIVLAGASAGVAAAFNTPLAGIVFAIEEMARAFEQRNSSIVLAAIVFSGAAAMSISGNYNYFGYTNAELTVAGNWLAILLAGVSGGLLGSVFCKMVVGGGKHLREMYNGFGSKNPVIFAGICGIVIAVIGFMTHDSTYGTGYTVGYSLLHSTMTPLWWQIPAKMLTTAVSAVSGITGGVFAPSLSIGATIGGELSKLLPHTSTQGIILLSMAAYFAAVTQAPITAFVIVLEITGNATAAVPLIAAALIAAAIARMLCPTSLYHALAKNFIIETKKRVSAQPVI